MGLYSRYVLPKLIYDACRGESNAQQREKVVPLAHGDVLEIGIGTGLNLSHYDSDRVTRVIGVDPSPRITRLAQEAADEAPFDVEFIGLPGEEIPLDDGSIDSVLMTYTLCSIPDTETALRQMARVLKPGGTLVYCEHGAAPDASVRRWQRRLEPVWGRLAGGCHLSRDIPRLLEQGGFVLDNSHEGYIDGWRPTCFNYWGTASAG